MLKTLIILTHTQHSWPDSSRPLSAGQWCFPNYVMQKECALWPRSACIMGYGVARRRKPPCLGPLQSIPTLLEHCTVLVHPVLTPPFRSHRRCLSLPLPLQLQLPLCNHLGDTLPLREAFIVRQRRGPPQIVAVLGRVVCC